MEEQYSPFIQLLLKLEEKASDPWDVYIRGVVLSPSQPPVTDSGSVVEAVAENFTDRITVYVKAFADYPKPDRVREFVRAVAHEFRHLDQNQHWDMLPVVDSRVSLEARGWEEAKYLADPGEVDARDFSQKFLEEAVTEEFLEAVREWLKETTKNLSKDIVVSGK